ncbi:MAG: trypsin-like peptidase domain-containing protein [Patescibacteria group bacterium]
MRTTLPFLIVAVIIAFFVLRWLPTPDLSNLHDLSNLPRQPQLETSIPNPTTAATTTPTAPAPKSDSEVGLRQSQPSEPDRVTLNRIQTELNQAAQKLQLLQNNATTPPAPVVNVVEPPRLTQAELYDKAIERVVNMWCQLGRKITIASGVLISSNGHILTNAHVAEDFVNQPDYECLIRRGSPARNLGYAKLVFFPQSYTATTSWTGQAENDISIWQVTRPTGVTPLPDAFPYYEIDPAYTPILNQPLATFSYASELLGLETQTKSLGLLFSETTVADFDSNLIISQHGLGSQGGSSGGALVDIYTNKFAGLISRGVGQKEEFSNISQRVLFSLTPGAINRIFQTETGQSLGR